MFSFVHDGEQTAALVKSRGYRKVLIIHSLDPATKFGVTKIIEPLLLKQGTTFTTEGFEPGTTDFKTLAAKHARGDYDCIVMHGFGRDLPFLPEALKQQPRLASLPRLTSLSTLDVPLEKRSVLSGAEFFAPVFVGNPGPKVADLQKRYETRFPNAAFTYSSVYAYDAYSLLVRALIDGGSADPLAIKKRLQTPTKALSDTYTFTESGDTIPSVSLHSIDQTGNFQSARE